MINEQPKYLMWDLPLRVFKWGFSISIVGAVISGKTDNIVIHERFALTVLGLLLFRFIWGFIGSETARFSHFIHTPIAVFFDGMDILKARKKQHFGHSALGGYATLLLLLVPLAIVATGLFSTDDVLFDGPLAHFQPDWIRTATRLHHMLHPVLFAVLFLHLLAIIIYWWRLRINLVKPIVIGKTAHTSSAIHISRMAQLCGILLMIGCIGIAQLLPQLRPDFF